MKRIWIRAKPDTPEATEPGKALAEAFKARGCEVLAQATAPLDLCVCLGGDGTVLATLRDLGELRFEVPILAIHASHGLGFLHSIRVPVGANQNLGLSVKDWAKLLVEAVLAKRTQVEERSGLEAVVLDADVASSKGMVPLWAFNDVVVTKGSHSRLVVLRVKVNGSLLLQKMRGDGLIVSSAVGSTAYSLSAGGPIVQPTLRSLVVTPICSHEVSQRPIVLDQDSHLLVELIDQKESCYLTCDGQTKIDVQPGQSIQIRRAPKVVRWMMPVAPELKAQNYFELLHSKLHYGGKDGLT